MIRSGEQLLFEVYNATGPARAPHVVTMRIALQGAREFQRAMENVAAALRLMQSRNFAQHTRDIAAASRQAERTR